MCLYVIFDGQIFAVNRQNEIRWPSSKIRQIRSFTLSANRFLSWNTSTPKIVWVTLVLLFPHSIGPKIHIVLYSSIALEWNGTGIRLAAVNTSLARKNIKHLRYPRSFARFTCWCSLSCLHVFNCIRRPHTIRTKRCEAPKQIHIAKNECRERARTKNQ